MQWLRMEPAPLQLYLKFGPVSGTGAGLLSCVKCLLGSLDRLVFRSLGLLLLIFVGNRPSRGIIGIGLHCGYWHGFFWEYFDH